VGLKLSRGEIDRLGERLRNASGPLDSADRELLQQVLREHSEVLDRAVAIVEDGLYPRQLLPTPRLKSELTLVEKLRREPGMRLSRMQDVAGMRIVDDMTRVQQDELARRIADLFDRARIADRRAKPSSGYRAVHVVATIEGRFVEIQLRTVLQNLWAQAFERLGDVWGRQIRYGLAPDDPDRPESIGAGTRRDRVHSLLKLSEVIAENEEATAALVNAELSLGDLGEPESDADRDWRDALEEDLRSAKEREARTAEELRRGLETMIGAIERRNTERVDSSS